MNIDDLSFLTELTDEDASHLNGGQIDDGCATAYWYQSIGDDLYALGLDGSSWYAAAANYYWC